MWKLRSRKATHNPSNARKLRDQIYTPLVTVTQYLLLVIRPHYLRYIVINTYIKWIAIAKIRCYIYC